MSENNPFAQLDKNKFAKDHKKSKTKTNHAKNPKLDEESSLFLASIQHIKKLDKKNDQAIILAEQEEFKEIFKDIQKPKISKQAKQSIKTANPVPAKQITQEQVYDDDLDFAAIMQDANPLQNKGRELMPKVEVKKITPIPIPKEIDFVLSRTEDYVEAYMQGLDLMLLGKLKTKETKPEAHLDLHGLKEEEAYHSLQNFIKSSYFKGQTVLLVITGKGNNSLLGNAILKNSLESWLINPPLKQVVLAFCNALNEDGGSGAFYILLRKYKKNLKINFSQI